MRVCVGVCVCVCVLCAADGKLKFYESGGVALLASFVESSDRSVRSAASFTLQTLGPNGQLVRSISFCSSLQHLLTY